MTAMAIVAPLLNPPPVLDLLVGLSADCVEPAEVDEDVLVCWVSEGVYVTTGCVDVIVVTIGPCVDGSEYVTTDVTWVTTVVGTRDVDAGT